MNKGRRALLIGVGTVAVVGVGAVAADLVTEAKIAAAVRRRLPMLKLDEEGLHAFAKAQIATLLAKRPSWGRLKTHLRTALAKKPVVHYEGISTDKRTSRERLEDNLATVFLLSSDFFWTGADESRVVKFREFYDPMRACGNPFARSPTPVDVGTS
jgi:hypothetical protein